MKTKPCPALDLVLVDEHGHMLAGDRARQHPPG